MQTELATEYPWLRAALGRAATAIDSGRVPHAILILAHPGLGAVALADFFAASMLCGNAPKPCGRCNACRLLVAEHHPDLHRVRREQDAQQIKVDQIRALIDSLSLTSFRGGYKVGIIENAESMNAAAANSLLKTLEEPAGDTLLLLVAARAHRLPPTIVSRCQRIAIDAPSTAQALEWLRGKGVSEAHARSALHLYPGAPLAALQADHAACAALARDMPATLQALAERSADASRVADQWAQSTPLLRLSWLETWVTQRIREQMAPAAGNVKSVDPVGLSASLLKAKIRPLFHLLGEVRQVRRSADSSLNLQLALESLLIRHFAGATSAF